MYNEKLYDYSRKRISLRAKKIYLAFMNVIQKYGIWKSQMLLDYK